MAVTDADLIRALREAQDSLNETYVENARRTRRVRNEDDEEFGFEEGGIDEGAGDEGGFEDEPTEEAEPGDTVEIPEGATIQIVADEPIEAEIIEDEEEEEPEEEITEEEEPVQNSRVKKWRNVKNYRLIKNGNSTSVLVPVEEEAPKKFAKKGCCGGKKSGRGNVCNVRTYRTRTVTRNADGLDVTGTYAKKLDTPGIASFKDASIKNMAIKARRYDRLVQNAELQDTVNKLVEDALKNSMQKAGIQNARTVRKATPKVYRTKNYRLIRNEDGTTSVEININTDDIAPVPAVAAEPIDIEVDGEAIPVDNRRTVRRASTQNGRVKRTATIHNGAVEVEDAFGLEIPSTFPTKE